MINKSFSFNINSSICTDAVFFLPDSSYLDPRKEIGQKMNYITINAKIGLAAVVAIAAILCA